MFFVYLNTIVHTLVRNREQEHLFIILLCEQYAKRSSSDPLYDFALQMPQPYAGMGNV